MRRRVAELSAETPRQGAALDPDSLAWLQALRGSGAPREEAIRRLHELLLRAARFEVFRRQSQLLGMGREELDDVAMQAADDAVVAVLARLDSFRGDSRFSTWAYKFAILEAAVKVRRLAWRAREVALPAEGWSLIEDTALSPGEETEQTELLDAVRRAIAEALTPHQRGVLLAVTVEGVPIDVLADRLSTTRGALYKTVHDARRKLRACLAAWGIRLTESDE